MALRLGLLLVLALLLAACGGSSETTPSAAPTTTAAAASRAAEPIPRLAFGYDRSAPLAYVDHGRVNRPSYPIAVHDVEFESRGQKIVGYLLLPPGKVKRPAVVFVHGSAGDRVDLLGQASWLAARNVVTLTLTEPSTAYAPVAVTSLADQLRQVRDVQVRDVVAVRRAIDLLRTLPQVDPRRVGYVGWSAGAKTGALVAASEPRLDAVVLLSAGAAPLASFIQQAPTKLKPQVRTVLGSIDPLRYVGRARPGTLLLENGRSDEIVPRAALQNMVEAAPKGTKVSWYAAPHDLNEAAYHDAFEWLEQKLRVTGPNVPGAAIESGG